MSDSNSLSRRRFLQATGGAAGAVALAGCTGDGNGDGDGDGNQSDGDGDGDGGGPTPTPQEGGTLNLINSTITTFDPVSATDTASGRVIQQVFDSLMNYPNGETEVVKQLAESYETSSDFTTYTFNLKQGATYHNGDEVTAQDFVYAWERLARSPHTHRAYFILDSLGVSHETDGDGNYQAGTLAVTAEDDYTLTIEMEEAFASTLSMLAYTAFAPVPDGHIGAIEDEADDEGEPTDQYNEFAKNNPVGAGAFVFDHWTQSEEAAVTRYDDYHGQAPYLEGIHWAVIEDDTAQFNYVRNNNADYFGIPTAQYDPANVTVDSTDDKGRDIGSYELEGESVNWARIAEVSTYYFAFNAPNVPKPVRQAVAYVTNQQQFANQVFKGRVAPAYHLTPPLIYPGRAQAYDDHAKNNYPYGYNESDIQSAQQVMEDAGYGENNRFQLTFTHYTSDTWNQMAQILRDQLGAAYIDMEIEQAEFSTLLQRGRNGNLQAYTLGWIADWPAPDNFLQLIYPPRTDTSEPGPLSYTNWDDVDSQARRDAESAFETVLNNRQPTDEAEQTRNDAYTTIEEANWEDVIFVNTFHGLSEPMWYDGVHVPLHGAMGSSRMMHNNSWKEQ